MHLDLVSSVRWRRQRCLASVFVILAMMMIQLLCYSENSAHTPSLCWRLKGDILIQQRWDKGKHSYVATWAMLAMEQRCSVNASKPAPPSPGAAVAWIAIKTSLFVSDCNWTHVHWLSKSNCTSTCQKMEACPILGGIIDIKCLERDKSDGCHSVPFIHPSRFQTSMNISKMAKSDFPGKFWQLPSRRGRF